MTKAFPYNPTLISMSYAGEVLELVFRKPKRKTGIQTRRYGPVPQDVIYKWYYKESVSDILSYYAKHIRKKFDLLEVK